MSDSNNIHCGWKSQLEVAFSKGQFHKLVTWNLFELDEECNLMLRTNSSNSSDSFTVKDWGNTDNPNSVIYRQYIYADGTEKWYDISSLPATELPSRPVDAVSLESTTHFTVTTSGIETGGDFVHTIDLAAIVPNYSNQMAIRVTAEKPDTSGDLHNNANYDDARTNSIYTLTNTTGDNHDINWYIEAFI